jgi:hypothetical protein
MQILSSKFFSITLFTLFLLPVLGQKQSPIRPQLLVVGGSVSGTMAAIQSARLGVQTLLIEEGPWLGGMMTAGGVSAIDGNHHLPSGLWGEFRENLKKHYGSEANLKTGWVSNTMFEPKVGAKILAQMCGKEQRLRIKFGVKIQKIKRLDNAWQITLSDSQSITVPLLIDATELGDVVARLGIKADIGMDARTRYNERIAPEQANDIVQDLTYVAILKDYGPNANKIIPMPAGYDKENFRCACKQFCNDPNAKRQFDCDKMLTYGELQNKKYMLNWPVNGNDFYVNMLNMNEQERANAIRKAKEFTLSYVYFIQNELGFKHLGLADDEFPTKDGLALIPYHRESRRIDGLAKLTMNDMEQPFGQKAALYRTGIAVGDYPIDQHHGKNTAAPDLYYVAVPSYNVPLGSLIPRNQDGIIVAEKSISVSNLANGATRLQPVVMQIGQAAGALAAECLQTKRQPRQVSVRAVQRKLLSSKVYLMPYFDVPQDNPSWEAIQRVGATGILKGKGVSVNWSNRTYFYPDSTITTGDFLKGIKEFDPSWVVELPDTSQKLTYGQVFAIMKTQDASYDYNRPVTRRALAVLLDKYWQPFFKKEVGFDGFFK